MTAEATRARGIREIRRWGVIARLIVGGVLVGSVVIGHIRGFHPLPWLVGLLLFPAAILIRFTRDAALHFYGTSMLLAAVRGYAGVGVGVLAGLAVPLRVVSPPRPARPHRAGQRSVYGGHRGR